MRNSGAIAREAQVREAGLAGVVGGSPSSSNTLA